ncbi:hypothetical protein [Cysteiniphilum sp. 6C5]|uniref:hypothetical protein n=1 Tax=unclassified Cysteiniphilum TaxID=2610889 RepID=UPI003F87E251
MMKRATLLSLTLHLSVLLVIVLLCTLAKYINNIPQKPIDIALTKESIPAHIVYLSKTTINRNIPNSVISPIKKSSAKESKQAATTADTQLIMTHDSKLKIETNPPKQVKPLQQEDNKVKKIERNKTLPQAVSKGDDSIQLNTAPASANFSTAREINEVMSALQTALSNYLAKQPSPDKSLNLIITLTVNSQGILEKISFSPLPPEALQNLLIHFLQSQNYTHKLLLPHSIDINIPLQLITK